MIDVSFLGGLGLDPEQIGAVMAAHAAEKRLRAACLAEGISLNIAEKVIASVSVEDLPTEDPELLRLLVRETWGSLANKQKLS